MKKGFLLVAISIFLLGSVLVSFGGEALKYQPTIAITLYAKNYGDFEGSGPRDEFTRTALVEFLKIETLSDKGSIVCNAEIDKYEYSVYLAKHGDYLYYTIEIAKRRPASVNERQVKSVYSVSKLPLLSVGEGESPQFASVMLFEGLLYAHLKLEYFGDKDGAEYKIRYPYYTQKKQLDCRSLT